MSRLAIDWTRCDGHGSCAVLLDPLVTLDEWGFPLFDAELPDIALADARRAVAFCPALALRLE